MGCESTVQLENMDHIRSVVTIFAVSSRTLTSCFTFHIFCKLYTSFLQYFDRNEGLALY